MAFYFVNWILTSDGYVPALPEGIFCQLLAEPSGDTTYGVYDVPTLHDELPDGVAPVPADLAKLLLSALAYPPAIAIAREEVRRVRYPGRPEFASALAARLSVHLAAQATSPIFLAKVNGSNTLYATPGCYYWIVNYQPNRKGRELSWVSNDYFIYPDPMDDFDVDPAMLAERFPPSYRLSPDDST